MFGRNKKKGEAKAAKPKKEKKAKAKKAKAPKAKKPSTPAKKRPLDVFTVMLMTSLGFVVLACVFLVVELGSYGFSTSNFTPWK